MACGGEFAQCVPSSTKLSCCAPFGCHTLNPWYSQCGSSCPRDSAWQCHRARKRHGEIKQLFHSERAAWQQHPGCGRPLADPYSDKYANALACGASHSPLQWSTVQGEWRKRILRDGVCRAQLIYVSISAGEIAALACVNASKGTLSRYRTFKLYLSAALAGLGSAPPPPDVAFVLDLTDRGDEASRVGLDVPSFASSSGCRRNIPIPFALKGWGSDVWQESLRRQGASWRWPSVAWESKLKQAIWRGAVRAFDGPCAPPGLEHPRKSLVALHSVGGAEPKRPRLRVNASFTACGEAHDQAWCAAALAGSGHFPDRGVRFDELARSKAVVEVDGWGYQATLLAKLMLGSVVISPASSYPLWFDRLLKDGKHLIRPAANLHDLPRRLRWLADHDNEAAAIARAGQRRACELLAPTHVAGLVARLLRAYARRFVGTFPPSEHQRVTQQQPDTHLLAPERLWFMRLASAAESERHDQCAMWWTGEASCNESRASIGKEIAGARSPYR